MVCAFGVVSGGCDGEVVDSWIQPAASPKNHPDPKLLITRSNDNEVEAGGVSGAVEAAGCEVAFGVPP